MQIRKNLPSIVQEQQLCISKIKVLVIHCYLSMKIPHMPTGISSEKGRSGRLAMDRVLMLAATGTGDLIDHRTKQWNRPLIHTTSMQSTRDDILRIKLGNLQARGRIFWKQNKTQQFTVKTAYQVALRLNHSDEVEHSLARDNRKLWNKLWNLGIPPKVRNFVRRACSDILPTRANLFRRKIPIAQCSMWPG